VSLVAYTQTGFRLPTAVMLWMQGIQVTEIEETPHLTWPTIVVFDPDAQAANFHNQLDAMEWDWGTA
jgi:hypothetical protein